MYALLQAVKSSFQSISESQNNRKYAARNASPDSMAMYSLELNLP